MSSFRAVLKVSSAFFNEIAEGGFCLQCVFGSASVALATTARVSLVAFRFASAAVVCGTSSSFFFLSYSACSSACAFAAFWCS